LSLIGAILTWTHDSVKEKIGIIAVFMIKKQRELTDTNCWLSGCKRRWGGLKGLYWTFWIFPTYGFWGFWGEIRPKKRQKLSLFHVFARFCITFARF